MGTAPVIHIFSTVEVIGSSVDIKFLSSVDDPTFVTVDRATAARLINQLRRALDEDYNRAINERPGGSDDYA